MKREEQIIQASEEWTYQTPPQYSELVHKSPKVMCAYQVGFIDGAVWADSTMIERACEYYQHELQQVASIMGRLRKGGGELIKIKESVEQFKIAMQNGFTSKTEVPT